MSAQLTESLREYYSVIFPAQQIVNWLNYKDDDDVDVFRNREFSMTLPGEIYIRYLAFEDHYDLKKELVRKIPIKIDVGAVYNASPRAHKSMPIYDFRPVQHELVFDIDISDYNDVRTCCQESNICQKCWPFMAIGAKVLNTILTKEFGFKHLLFVFSGRRGFHCWVCDKEARYLTNEARRAIADYFALIKGGENLVRRVEIDTKSGLHPLIIKSLDVIDEHFEDLMVHKQDFLSNEHLIQNVIDLLPPLATTDEKNPDQHFKNSLFQCKMRKSSSADLWDFIKRSANQHKRNKTRYYLEEVKLHHCFPRLDTNVTRGMNHLLKLPFCIHPKTGNVCVPLDIETIDKFQLDQVPNIKDLQEFNTFNQSLEPYFNIMKKFCSNLEKSSKRKDSLDF
uniref:DNA primase n=1 Tax=Aceria tosichella TaxID=561515 RepID=A0A6G1SQP5_9ACAR